jgi:hypothetical protein
MSTLDDAKHILDRSQGDVRSEEYKHDLYMQALITAIIALVETQQAMVEKLENLNCILEGE